MARILKQFDLLGVYLCEKVGIYMQVWNAYKDQRHDLFLPSNAQTSAAGVAGLIESSSSTLTYALTAPTPHPS